MSNNELPPNDVLREIYSTGFVIDKNGEKTKLHSAISPELSSALYKTVLKYKPKLCIEIGMCCALSSMSILTALKENNNGGKLISIDPFQTDPEHEKGIGLLNVTRSGLEDLHELIEKPSYLALPELLAIGCKPDFAYIDGWHTFDYALLDFFYIDKMTDPDAVVAFNDCGWRSVNKVLKFVISHRKYQEIDVGLKRTYTARNPLFSLIKRLEGRVNTDRYFIKTESWEPTYSFYKHF